MGIDPLAFLDEPESSSNLDPLAFLDKPKRSAGAKAGRLAAQYGIGTAQTAALPYELAVTPLTSKKAQHGEYRKGLFEDIERLQEQKASGGWDEQDEVLYNSLINQIKNPEEAEKFVRTADIGIGNLAEKGARQFGLDLSPEDLGEDAARIIGNLRNPKQLLDIGKKRFSLLDKEARSVAKVASQWKSLEALSKGSAEKAGLLSFAKKTGLSPEETTLLMQSKGKAETLGKIAKKTKKYKGAVEGLNQKLGANYEKLKAVGRKGGYLGAKESDMLSKDLTKMLDDMGRTLVEGPDTTAARAMLEKALVKLDNQGATVEDLINSRINLGQGINWKNIDPKGAMLKRGRDALMKTIEKANPKIGKELKLTDEGWAKYSKYEDFLNKKQAGMKIAGVEVPASGLALGAAVGAASYFAPILGKAYVAKEAVQRLSTQLITNPRFQEIHKKLVNAVLAGDKEKQKGILAVLKKTVKSEDADLYSELGLD